MKAQIVRLADVFFIGPVMVYGGAKLRQDSKWLGWTLIALGVATVLYNGRNYLVVRQQRGVEA